MARLPYFDRCDEIHKQAKAYYHENGTLEGAPHATTKKHYTTYAAMVKTSHLAISDLGLLGVDGLQDLTLRYLCPGDKGQALNSIPLRKFDVLFASYRVYNARPEPGQARSACDYVCCLKHILIYDVLKLKPVFVEIL